MNYKVYNDGINKSCKSQLNEENSNNLVIHYLLFRGISVNRITLKHFTFKNVQLYIVTCMYVETLYVLLLLFRYYI